MVKSLDRALSILEFLSRCKSAGVTEIAQVMDMDKGSVSRILKTFEKHNMVAKSNDSGKYHVSSGILQLSHNVTLNNRILQVAHPLLEELVRITNATARLCVIEGKKIFIIDQVRSTKGSCSKDTDIPGMTKPMYCSAIGKVALAFMPQKITGEWVKQMEMTAYTENTLGSQEALKEQLLDIRKQGYALNLAEYSDRAYCIAVPVFCNDKLRYCLGITGWNDFRKDKESFDNIIRLMKEASRRITGDYEQMQSLRSGFYFEK